MADTVQRRRPRGAGGVHEVSDGVWRVDVELPQEPGSARRRGSRTVRGSRAEAEQVLAELRSDEPGETEVQTFNVRLSSDVATSLRRAAAADGVSISEEIRRAIVDRVAGRR